VAENDDSIVLIGVAENELEVNVWRDILSREGIEALVRADDPLAPLGATPLPASLKVYVLARDEKRARWLLGDNSASE
jgi:hypothetical protein